MGTWVVINAGWYKLVFDRTVGVCECSLWTCLLGSGRDHLFLCQRRCVNKGLHGGLPKAPASLMGSLVVGAFNPFIQIGLQLGDGVVVFLRKAIR